MKKILTVAGYDPSSGAGVMKDLDVFHAFGIHGIAVPTSNVIQGPHGVRTVFPVPHDQFVRTLEVTTETIAVDGVKTGVLLDEPYVETVATYLNKAREQTSQRPVFLVIDPVLSSKNGTTLLSDRGVDYLKRLLFPLAAVVTPNIPEATALTGINISTIADMQDAARSISDLGPAAVIIKGGHLMGEPVDLLYDGKDFTTFPKKRIDRVVHGTGCIMSSLITCFLVRGYLHTEACLAVQTIMERLIEEGYRIDTDGYFYTSPGILNHMLAERWEVLQAMREARERFVKLNPVELIPAVQMNIGYAVSDANNVDDVAAFPGRIGVCSGRVHVKDEPAFGASSHIARLLTEYMRYNPWIRACANVRYDQEILKKAETAGLNVAYFDRRQEPDTIKTTEGKSLNYLVDAVMGQVHSPPDIIYDTGDTGKEPIIRLFARDPLELIKRMEMILP